MILACGEALIDFFVDAPEDKHMPARAADTVGAGDTFTCHELP
ncbi:hypothetical protein [Bosea sp. 117]|nr:hypothetical protein [Bosea sp. 117]